MTHGEGCPYAPLGQQPKHHLFTFSIQLLPFFAKTVSLSLGASFYTGGLSIYPSLAISTTVRRSESPLFRLFDEFPLLCARKRFRDEEYTRWLELGNTQLWVSDNGGAVFRLDWDEDAVPYQLGILRRNICSLATRGSASLSDQDDRGNTVLHVSSFPWAILPSNTDSVQEIIRLILLLGSTHTAATEEIESLLVLAAQGELDSASLSSRNPHCTFIADRV